MSWYEWLIVALVVVSLVILIMWAVRSARRDWRSGWAWGRDTSTRPAQTGARPTYDSYGNVMSIPLEGTAYESDIEQILVAAEAEAKNHPAGEVFTVAAQFPASDDPMALVGPVMMRAFDHDLEFVLATENGFQFRKH